MVDWQTLGVSRFSYDCMRIGPAVLMMAAAVAAFGEDDSKPNGNESTKSAVASGSEGGSQSPAPARSSDATAQEIIDALANQNPAPIAIKAYIKKRPNTWFPLFSEKYDWKEDKRVTDALNRLLEAYSVDFWPVLASNCLDKRYALTRRLDEQLHIMTVGDICHIIAQAELRRSYFSPSPRLPWNGYPVPPLQLFDTPAKLAEWWAPRRGKPLYELQIEAAELALAQTPKFNPELVPRDRADRFVKLVTANISQLRESKKALAGRVWPYIDATRGFGSESAKEIREAYEAEQHKRQLLVP